MGTCCRALLYAAEPTKSKPKTNEHSESRNRKWQTQTMEVAKNRRGAFSLIGGYDKIKVECALPMPAPSLVVFSSCTVRNPTVNALFPYLAYILLSIFSFSLFDLSYALLPYALSASPPPCKSLLVNYQGKSKDDIDDLNVTAR